MKKKLSKQYWGWGIHVDAKGNLHDVFPAARNDRQASGGNKSKRVWRVKPRAYKPILAKS